MRFEVPQFIDVEEKIFGPLTFKQFIYLLGGAGLAYTTYKILPFPLSWVGVIFFPTIGLLLAFYKVNNQKFITIAQAFLNYQIKGKLYIWKREPLTKKTPPPIPQPPKVDTAHQAVSPTSIAELARNLDILDK